MYKKVFTLAVLITTSCVWAQNTDNDYLHQIDLGLKIGANYSDVYDTEGNEFNPQGKMGFAAGFFANIPITEYVGIQPELLYSEKGFKATGNGLGNTYEFSRTSSYLDFPVFLTLKPIDYFTIMVGPQYSYLLSQRNSFTNGTSSIETERNIDNEDTRSHTFGLVGGFDVYIQHFVVGTRIGLDAFRNTSEDGSIVPAYKYVWLQGTVGYRF